MQRFFNLLFAATLFLILDVLVVKMCPAIPDFYVFFIFIVGTFCYYAATADDDISDFLEGTPRHVETCEDMLSAWKGMARFSFFVFLCFAVGLLGKFLLSSDPQAGLGIGCFVALFGIMVTRSLITEDGV